MDQDQQNNQTFGEIPIISPQYKNMLLEEDYFGAKFSGDQARTVENEGDDESVDEFVMINPREGSPDTSSSAAQTNTNLQPTDQNSAAEETEAVPLPEEKERPPTRASSDFDLVEKPEAEEEEEQGPVAPELNQQQQQQQQQQLPSEITVTAPVPQPQPPSPTTTTTPTPANTTTTTPAAAAVLQPPRQEDIDNEQEQETVQAMSLVAPAEKKSLEELNGWELFYAVVLNPHSPHFNVLLNTGFVAGVSLFSMTLSCLFDKPIAS